MTMSTTRKQQENFLPDLDADALRDPMQMAVHFTRMEGVIATLQQGFTQSNQNISSVMQSMQADLRNLNDTLKDFSSVQRGLQENHESVKRIWEHMEERDKAWQERFDRTLDAQREQRDLDIADSRRWQREHEAKNEGTAHKVNRIGNIALGVSLAAGSCTGLVAYFADQTNKLATMDRLRIDAEQSASAIRDDERLDRLEIHLAGDTRRPFRR